MTVLFHHLVKNGRERRVETRPPSPRFEDTQCIFAMPGENFQVADTITTEEGARHLAMEPGHRSASAINTPSPNADICHLNLSPKVTSSKLEKETTSRLVTIWGHEQLKYTEIGGRTNLPDSRPRSAY
ncbi:hypothetical protein MVEN_02494300 [Mycena venus]|uniref:Uncharacterized protein n=1 Tax=Mycena venus TaxID=2733690 RepID=A0A8H6WXM3_9AGAR|nr:hypothetical protein MVEN_02494300 [Mycena venus]